MSYNLSMIISMFFVVPFVLLGGDLYSLQAQYSSIDNIAITIGYLIAKNERVDTDFLTMLESKYNVYFDSITPSSPSPGEAVEFTIYRMYSPLIVSTNQIKIVAKRNTVMGYYG